MARRAPGKNPGGRPSKFDPEHWAKVAPSIIAAGKKGKSFVSFALLAGVPRSTLEDWERNIPEVSGTLADAKALSQQWFEDIAAKNIDGKASGDMATLRFMLMNRFRKDYASERTESTVKSETKLDLQGAENVLAGVSAEDLRALLAAKEAETDDGK